MPLTRRLVLASAAALAATPALAAAPVTLGGTAPLPDVSFEDLAGKPAKLSDFRGKVVVLNLWATWCNPCREEMPSLDRLQAMFADQPVQVVALAVDRAGPERVAGFLQEIGVGRLAVYRDPTAAATRTLRLPGLPVTILVDRAGNERGRVLGLAEWDGEAAKAAVRSLVDETAG